MGETSCELTSSYFAEFLNEGSPVHLRLLAQSTCVGFSTDLIILTLEAFPGTLLIFVPPPKVKFQKYLELLPDGFACLTFSVFLRQSNKTRKLLEYVTPSIIIKVTEY